MRKLNVVVLVFFALFVSSVARGQSGVNNAELHGNYAFTFTGVSGNGTVSSVFGVVGRFTADGAGNITNGELDRNTVGGANAAQSFTGTYSIGADHRGLMILNIAGGTARLAFAMMANGNAQFIEFDAAGGSGIIGSGTMEKADTTAFSTASITGDYAFGGAGFDNANNRAAIEGRFTSSGTGALSTPAGDLNGYGTDYPMTFTAANYSVSDAATGRGTMHLAFTFGGTPDALNFVFYVVNSGKLFFMESDVVSTTTPLLNGVVVHQQMPVGGFSNASLNGNEVIYLTGHSACGSVSGVPKVVGGLLTANGSGALSLTYDENFCSAPNSVTAAPGTYSVTSNGRTSITLGGYSLVGYLVDANEMFLFVSDANVLFGRGEPQAAVSFANSALKGTYAGFATTPVSFRVTAFSGEFAADGASPTGTLTGAEDISSSSGPSQGVAYNATYSISSSPTNGRGTMTVTSGTGGTAVIYMISPAKFVEVSQTDPYPALMEFDLFSAPASAALSSVSLNPASVVGGSQSSTGTVTLSTAAPTGGAQITLSSSNPTVASAPASVTIAAGATTASFTVTTSAVAASTVVTISATYGGTTKSASLTVTPAPPPSPTLSSFTLNPTSVVGGVQSSTGTVTLTGPAPAGGAQVALSSSNAAVAQVPSSVTVAAGASSASFTVSTSVVTASTTVNISATYNGVSRSASLTVTPPLPTVLSVSLNPSSVIGGLQSSTGTVKLSGPAPSGGAVVALSSSGPASVPPHLTVPARSTTVSFTVNTSIVLASTSSTISASYNSTSRSATLNVLL